MEKTPVYILGSCATRDAFEFDFAEPFELRDYSARTSFASLSFEPDTTHKSILNKISSPFQKRMVERDMTKMFWKKMTTYDGGYILLDLVDDRFPLMVFDAQRANTLSLEFANAAGNSISEAYQKLPCFSPEYQESWEKGLERFARELETAKVDGVFVNCVYFLATGDKKLDQDNRVYEMNDYLDDAYTKLAKVLGKETLVRYADVVLDLDPAHKWGLAPYHYGTRTYRYFLQQVLARTR